MFKRIALLGLSLFFSIACLEFGIFLLTKMSLLQMPVPSYSLAKRTSLDQDARFWADQNPHFGVWHTPNALFRHTKSCFDVQYEANEHGQRDRPRALESTTPRFAVIGDSMIEGFGVERADRMTDRLEEATGTPFLNFGTAGDFGPTQYHLLYRHLASTFRHDAVLVGLLPANDFRDDDIEFGRRVYADRYRPYWTGEAPNFELTYVRKHLDEGPQDERTSEQLSPRRVLRNFSYTYNALLFARELVARREIEQSSSFYDYTPLALARMEHSLSLIKQDAGDRPVVLMLIPIEDDFIRRGDGPRSPLSQDLRAFADREGFHLIDLLEAFAVREQPWDPDYLPCDGHWSPRGHSAAAQTIQVFLEQKGLIPLE